MRYLRTNTAARITVGPFFDKTDGVTPETAITVTACKLTFMVDDANVPTLVLDTNPTASGGANDMVHVTGDDAGFYDLELAAANVNYLGRAMVAITDASVHCPVFHEFMIIPANIYDSMILGTDLFDVSVTQLLGTAWLTPGTAGTPDVNMKLISGDSTAADNAESFFDGTGYNGTGNVIPLVNLVTTTTTTTNLTNPPSIFTGTASDAATDSVTFVFDGDPTGMSIVVDSDEGTENRVVDEWDPLNGIATVVPAFANTPSGTITVTLYPLGARVATQLEDDLAAVKAVTDQVEFTVPGQISSNVKSVKDGLVDGDGSDSDPWGPVE